MPTKIIKKLGRIEPARRQYNFELPDVNTARINSAAVPGGKKLNVIPSQHQIKIGGVKINTGRGEIVETDEYNKMEASGKKVVGKKAAGKKATENKSDVASFFGPEKKEGAGVAGDVLGALGSLANLIGIGKKKGESKGGSQSTTMPLNLTNALQEKKVGKGIDMAKKNETMSSKKGGGILGDLLPFLPILAMGKEKKGGGVAGTVLGALSSLANLIGIGKTKKKMNKEMTPVSEKQVIKIMKDLRKLFLLVSNKETNGAGVAPNATQTQFKFPQNVNDYKPPLGSGKKN